VLSFQPGRVTALAVGPGVGRRPETRDAVREIVARVALPTVLDADGLTAFAGEADLLARSAAGRGLVLTPHPGEFAALTGEPVEAVQAARIDAASRWASRVGAVIVLKGAPTVIAEPDTGTVYVNPSGNEALATGGTGDVLTGILGGFLAQGLGPVDAAVAAVYLHGWIAEYIVDDWGSPYGLEAGDLIDYFPAALGDFLSPPEADEKPRAPLR
jgi:NAD(P)H-hydrate epimerase